jgi:hypothetical protein
VQAYILLQVHDCIPILVDGNGRTNQCIISTRVAEFSFHLACSLEARVAAEDKSLEMSDLFMRRGDDWDSEL